MWPRFWKKRSLCKQCKHIGHSLWQIQDFTGHWSPPQGQIHQGAGILYVDIGLTKIGYHWRRVPGLLACTRLAASPLFPVHCSTAHYLKLIQTLEKEAVSSGLSYSVVWLSGGHRYKTGTLMFSDFWMIIGPRAELADQCANCFIQSS